MNAMPASRILIIDDTPSIHDDFRKVLAAPTASRSRLQDLASTIFGAAPPLPAAPTSFTLDFALQGQEGLALVEEACAQQRPYAVAFVDMRMPPGWDGLETISHLWTVDPDLQVVICTAYSDHSWSTITERLGHTHNLLILKKPFDHIEVLQLAHSLAAKWSLTKANRRQLAELDRTVLQRTNQLHAAEARFAEAFNTNPLPQLIIAHEPVFEVLAVNSAYEQQMGISFAQISQLTPETFGRGLDPRVWRDLMDRLERGESIDEHPFVFRPSPAVERHVRCSARSMQLDGRRCSIWLVRDITQELETEQQLRQSQKLEAIGQLAAGVAHDFNNMLTVIHGCTAEVLSRNPDIELQRLLGPVQLAASRAAALTRQLLVFSHKQVLQPRMINLETALNDVRPMLRRLIGADIAFEWDIAPALPAVIANVSSFEQIIVNLVVNARDAMPHGGRITIAAHPRQIDDATASRQIEAKAGDYIEIRISDTGGGIPPTVVPRIFEPFFTTKEVGKGTGLGLSTVYSIVKQHGGWIEVQSQVGVGTTFTFYHPVAPGAAASPPDPAAPAGELQCVSYQRVLLAEDDPTIRALLSAVLDRRSIKYDSAPDGVTALKLWHEHNGTHDLLITDLVMPNGVNGIRLAQEIRQQRPTLPVILMTGYSAALVVPASLAEIPGPKPRLLLKPFYPNDLFTAMNEVSPEELGPDGQPLPRRPKIALLTPPDPGVQA
jgi:PAS domain S-box-containing protein